MDWQTELDNTYKALEQADAAGNADDARQLAQYALQVEQMLATQSTASTLQQMQPQPAPETHWYDAPRAFLQGTTFGFSDELGAAASALGNTMLHRSDILPFTEQFKAEYDGNMAAFKEDRETFREENPVTSVGLEMAGGVLSGGVGGYKAAATGTKALANAGMTLPTFSNLSTLGKAGVLAAGGATEGALYGMGTADPGERTEGAAKGALAGAVLAPIAGGALSVVNDKVATPVAKAIYRKLTDTPEKQADRLIQRILDMEGKSVDEVTDALDQLGPDGVLADIGPNMQAVARDMADNMGPGKRQINDFLDTRQQGQQGRLMQAAETGMGASSDDFTPTVKMLERERMAQAKPLYEEAYASALHPTDTLQNLMNRPDMVDALKQATVVARNEGHELDETRLVEVFDYAKRALDDKWGTALRQGERNRARQIRNTINALLAEMDEQVPAYSKARNIYAGGSSLIYAGQLGRKILKADMEDLGQSLAGMGESERLLFRMGAVKAVRDEIEKSGATHDAVKRLFRSTDRSNRLKLAFRSPEEFEAFVVKAEAEAQKSSTRAAVQGNSRTAQYLKQSEQISDMADPGILSLASSDPLTTGMTIINRLLGKGELSPEAKAKVTDILFQQGLSAEDIEKLFRQRGGKAGGVLALPFDRRGAAAPGALAISEE